MSPDPNAAVYNEICRIMNVEWDPIGGCPADEYYQYSARAYSMLKDDAKFGELVQYLDWVKEIHMGLQPDKANSIHVSELIYELKERLV